MKVKSFAKIDLGYSVYKKRKNITKHDFESIFILVESVYDDIEIIKIDKNVDDVHYYNETNEIYVYSRLVYKTLEWIRQTYRIKNHYRINIKKRIPIGAGLGGGSSNAAVIMKSILELEGIKEINYKDVVNKLGADIPFFLSGYKTVYVSDCGSTLEDLSGQFKLSYEVHLMNVNVNTKLVFEKFDDNQWHVIKNNFKTIIKNLKENIVTNIYNDLQEHCFELYPNIRYKYNELLREGFYTILSGAGSSFICIKLKDKENQVIHEN